MTFFDILKNILQKENDFLYEEPGFKESFNSYMLVRYLSMRDSLLPFAIIIQSFQKAGISDLDIYKFAYKNIPFTNPYIKYIKPKKSNEKSKK